MIWDGMTIEVNQILVSTATRQGGRAILTTVKSLIKDALTGDAPTTSEWSTIFIAYWGAPYIRDFTVGKI